MAVGCLCDRVLNIRLDDSTTVVIFLAGSVEVAVVGSSSRGLDAS